MNDDARDHLKTTRRFYEVCEEVEGGVMANIWTLLIYYMPGKIFIPTLQKKNVLVCLFCFLVQLSLRQDKFI